MKTSRPGSLQTRTLMCGHGSRYFARAEGLPLSLKCMRNGRARYTVGRQEFAVDDGGWLVVNADQPYTIEIAAAVPVETFIIWFPRGWAEEVWHGATTGAPALLADPSGSAGPARHAGFFERYTPNEAAVAPLVHALRHANRAGEPLEEAWLEEKLRCLLERLLDHERQLDRVRAALPAVRASTREELWRRLSRARDFIHARCDAPISLSEMAQVAALSPCHFLRTFQAAFRQTPYAWLSACRVERAKFLLARTELPVTEICFAVGYEGIGSFSSWFRRCAGASPRGWRQAHGRTVGIRNIREVSDAASTVPSPVFP